jgi:hypothetical protein
MCALTGQKATYLDVSIFGVVFSGWIMNSEEAATAGSPLDFLLFFSKRIGKGAEIRYRQVRKTGHTYHHLRTVHCRLIESMRLHLRFDNCLDNGAETVLSSSPQLRATFVCFWFWLTCFLFCICSEKNFLTEQPFAVNKVGVSQ